MSIMKEYEIDVTYTGTVFHAFVDPVGKKPVALIRFVAYTKKDNLTGKVTEMHGRRMRSMILSLEGENPELNIYSLTPGDMVEIRERFEKREDYPGSCIVTNLTLQNEPDTFHNAKGVWD